MAHSFSQLLDIKSRIVRDLAGEQQKLTVAKGAFSGIASTLASMQTSYAGADGWASQVDEYAIAHPTDEAALALKAEKDALVAEFQSAKAEANSLDAAVQGV